MKTKSLKLNAFLNSLRSLLSVIFPLITFPYVSRVLSVEGIGKYNFSNSVVSYFLLIAGLGINTYAIREGAKYRDNKKLIGPFVNQMFTINVVSAVVAYVLLFICLIIFSKLHSYLWCILIYSIQIGFSIISVDWIFTIYEDFVYITIRNIAFQLLSIALLFVLVRNSNDYLNYAAITVFSAVGSNILNFHKANKIFDIRLTFKFNWKVHLIPICMLFAANIANMINVNSDVTILGILKNNYIVGIYSISSKIYYIINNTLAAVLLVTVPRLAMLLGKHKMQEYKDLFKRLINVLCIVTMPAMLGLILLSKQIILIVAGNHFLRSTVSLRILSVANIFAILAWALSDCVLIPAKREKYVLKGIIYSALSNIVINLALIPLFSEIAAALGTVIAEIVVCLYNCYYSKDIVGKILLSKELRRTMLDSIIGCVGIVIVYSLISGFISNLILATILIVILSIIVYALILLVLKDSYVLSILKQIRAYF